MWRARKSSPTIILVDDSADIRDVYSHALGATHPTILTEGRVGEASSFIVSVSGLFGVEESFRAARAESDGTNPRARRTPAGGAGTSEAGADVVVSGEGEVALAFTIAILERLGATPEQIDRTRQRPSGA
jgi:monovalent cation:H+ antiporter-2, CPA2 family